MTNEEKAEEIAKEYSRNYGFGINYDSSIECYQSAMAMAEWKNETFVEYMRNLLLDLETGKIEKAKSQLEDLINIHIEITKSN